jgi:hypothetical protein
MIKIKGTWFDSDGYQRDLVDGFCKIEQAADGTLFLLDAGNMRADIAKVDVDGAIFFDQSCGSFIPDAGEIKRIGLS